MTEIQQPKFESAGEKESGVSEIDFAEFLESVPPGRERQVNGLAEEPSNPNTRYPLGLDITPSDVQLHCDNAKCSGMRFFKFAGGEKGKVHLSYGTHDLFLSYVCRNCVASAKIYAIRLRGMNQTLTKGVAFKYGELPVFGPPVPPRVLSLIGPDRDTFLRGRRAENLGLGVGAFAYYRQVVERQKGRLLDEIGKVAHRIGAPQDVLDAFARARKETQFSKALDDVKDAIPEALKIKGHNPLTLLYGPLSQGIHDGTDEECLEMAGSIRAVLYELADRIGQSLKDEKELSDAVSRLLGKRGQK